jgi:hypothetical protein
LTGLVKRIDKELTANTKLRGFAVILTEDTDATSAKLKKLAKDAPIEKMPLTLFEGNAGPAGYGVPKDAEAVVHLYVKRKVKAKYVFKPGQLDDKAVDKIVHDLKLILE